MLNHFDSIIQSNNIFLDLEVNVLSILLNKTIAYIKAPSLTKRNLLISIHYKKRLE